MLKHLRVFRRLGVLCAVVTLLFFTIVPVALAQTRLAASTLIGPKKYYLALGDSLAFGYQPNFDFSHGYADDFFSNLKGHGTTTLADMGCPGETSSTFIKGGCSDAFLRKYPYVGAQLSAAVAYLKSHAGQVSPVTLDIGANDLLPDINLNACTANNTKFTSDLATLDKNLTGAILPQLRAAMTVNGKLTGDLVLMNYYDPYQNACSNSVSYIQKINTHLASDLGGSGLIVDVFKAFGGTATPNNNICSYTWMCSVFKDIHATRTGFGVIASAFESGVGY
jgi:lysophospholipase L1-like esterase